MAAEHHIVINSNNPALPPHYSCLCGDSHTGYDAIDLARAHALSEGFEFKPELAQRMPEIPQA